MATEYTQYYQLGMQTDHADKFDMTVITDDMEKIDTAMHDLDTGKADKPTKSTATIDNTALAMMFSGIVTGELATEITGGADTIRGIVRAYDTGSGTFLQIAEAADGTRKTRYYASDVWSAWA